MERFSAVDAAKHSRSLATFALLAVVSAWAAADTALDSVLQKMDETARQFRSAQANFTWTVYNKAINDVAETERGKIYFRRTSRDTQMAADVTQPDSRQIVFSQGKIQVYQPKIETIDVYDASAHREEFETFLVLGFGSTGEMMKRSFTIKDGGEETIDGLKTVKLELTPIAEKVREQFPQIILWIDPNRGLSVEQKLVEANGDYRLAKYSDIVLKDKLPDRVFHLPKAKVVNH
jgi:outer membrane lipoprotein-sorting protein